MRAPNRSLTVALALASVWVAACKGEAPVTKKADPASETPPAIAAPTGEPGATQIAAPMPPAAPRPIPPPLSSDAELHVIGIQMGAHAPDADTRPWWAKCGSDRSSEAAADCHRRYAGQRAKGYASVNVTLTGVPLVLALMGGEPVEWTVNIEPGARVEKVILAGSYAQEIAGIDRTIPIEIHGPHFSCESCTQIGQGFAAYDENSQQYPVVMRRLKQITGRSPSTIQFARQAGTGAFYVSTTLVHYTQLPETFRRWEAPPQ
jgi:hypothetical protein